MFFMDKKNIIKKLLPMGLLLAASVAIGVTGATVLHTLKLENPIKTPTVEGEIKEEKERQMYLSERRFPRLGRMRRMVKKPSFPIQFIMKPTTNWFM